MAASSKTQTYETIEVTQVEKGEMAYAILGTSPIILNRMSEKAQRILLAPSPRMTTAEKQANLKHNPLEEFRASPYTLREGETYLAALGSWFKQSMMTAALDHPGAKRTQIGRLVHAVDDRLPLYGIPQLMMAVTRSADMNRTPDIRTRAIVPHWACVVRMNWVQPILRQASVTNLLVQAGITSGAGDWRPQKGAGSYGSFEIVSHDDPRFQAVLSEGGREAQMTAMADPVFYDDETRSLYNWWTEEVTRRGFDVDVSPESFKPVLEDAHQNGFRYFEEAEIA